MSNWKDCRNILVIRLDNMGDLLMSSPAMRSLKLSFKCKITVLTSQMGVVATSLIPEIDEVILYDAPWMKLEDDADADLTFDIIRKLKLKKFDGCVVFNVYSQNPLAAVMMAYLSGIPLRCAYSRENLYGLLTHWFPDPEPYSLIKHQVQRDLDLVAFLGAVITDEKIKVHIPIIRVLSCKEKLKALLGADVYKPYVILHAGVSEAKRRYPKDLWIGIGKLLAGGPHTLLLTGTKKEKIYTEELANEIGTSCHSVAGLFSVEELAVLLENAVGMISVNTGTIHIGAAVQTPMVVLYAQTNPQHTPWMVDHYIMEFSVQPGMQSKNQVIQWVNSKIYKIHKDFPAPIKVVAAFNRLLKPEK
jgi:ADP-heptose:LPS heptosyltransferase